ncbi:MAG: hypothetical protein CMP19_10410 [Rickettsiales bacterium]|nr:hypothetical protein [Rickettsiales bacterium]
MQNVKYTEYDPVTGGILRTGRCTSTRLPKLPEGVGRVLKSADPEKHFIRHGEVANKIEFNVSAERVENNIKINNLPFGSVVFVEGEAFEMDDSGVFELTIDQPIDVNIVLTHHCYLTKVITVES